ncbi:cytochrome b/b6 domain-containing protein [Candidatus Ferrigenium straubiae]|jgi:cytochrome b|uniref:cytochrome b/b6 domain-containing protein n=1 Tax=Candidatus Ferrigenium straubiae TaxID=2919506 RepID=UPI003F4AB65D
MLKLQGVILSRRVLVWDVPTRLFHWLFAISFAAAWLTSENDQWLSVHTFFGYLILGLIGFRLIWGMVGGHYARFTSFLYGPIAGLSYLRQVISGGGARHIGHNPAGSQAVYLLIALALVVTITGLFTQGGEEHHGAVVDVVDIATAGIFKAGHDIAANLMLLLVFGHLAGVAMESWLHRENLPRSMVTGMKEAPEGTPVSRPYRRVGILLLVATVTFGGWWFSYALHEPVEGLIGYEDGDHGLPRVAFAGPKLADDQKWREECGSCHLAFHPSLLPARSWQKMMAEQEKHFGTDLALDNATSEVLLAFLVNNAAENSSREAAYKINQSIKAGDVPLRVTETPYWVKKHQGVAESVWHSPKVKSKANCAACHLDAEAGTFEDAAMFIPR